MTMRIKLLTFIGLVVSSGAFQRITYKSSSGTVGRQQPATLLKLTPEELRAQALSEYLSGPQGDNLRTIEELERKKRENIKMLKQRLEELRQGTTGTVSRSPPSTLAGTDSEKELLKKQLADVKEELAQYKKQVEVDKANAVKQAEEANKAKYEAELAKLRDKQLSTIDNEATALFDARNAYVARADAAGKSRWGYKENQKATEATMKFGGIDTFYGAVNGAMPVPSKIKADGGVGGWTLSERIAMGANVGAAAVLSPASDFTKADESTSLYDMRNSRISAAAALGKSRWGAKENDKARDFVQGSSQLDEYSAKKATPGIGSLYERRNGRVAAAAVAGKSRWGVLENKKAQENS